MAYDTILIENNPVNVLESFSEELNQDEFNIQSVITRDMGGFWSAKFSILNPRKNEALQMLHNGPGRSVKFFNERSIPVWEGFISKVTLSTGAASAFNDVRPVANDVWVRYRDFTTGNLSRSAHATHTNSQNKYGQKDWVLSGGQLRSTVADQKAENYLDLNFWATPQLDNFEIGGAGGGDIDLQVQCLGWWHTLDWRVYNQTILVVEANAAAVVEDIVGTFSFPVSRLLKTNLISWWTLDEFSAGVGPVTREDSQEINDLTDFGTTASAAGRVNLGADFEIADSTRLEVASNATLQTGDIEFTFGLWFKFESRGTIQYIMGKWNDSGVDNREYLIIYNNALNRFLFLIDGLGTGGAGFSQVMDTTVLASGVWYLVIAWHDPVANLIWIQVNNNVPTSAAHPDGVFMGPASLTLGARSDTPVGSHADGVGDEAFLYKRILTADERTIIYNGGSGISYDDIGKSTRSGGVAEFISGTDIGANATQVAQEYDADRRAGGIIKSIADLGDINGNVWIAGVGLNREFYFRSAAPPTEAA